MASGSNWVSASSTTMISAPVRIRPQFSADHLPPLGLRTTLTRGVPAKVSCTTCAVRSLEPSSTTMILNFFRCEASSARMDPQITVSSLNAGITTATDCGVHL